MDDIEKKSRIRYLMRKMKIVVRTKGFLTQVSFDRTIRKQNMHCLDTDIETTLPDEQYREDFLVFSYENFDDLPWYLLNPQGKFARIQNI